MEKCLSCSNEEGNFIKKWTISWFGFFECHNCHERYKLPLSKKDKRFYAILCSIFTVIFTIALTQWTIIFPWLLIIFPLIWLIKNKDIENAYNSKKPIRVNEKFKDIEDDSLSIDSNNLKINDVTSKNTKSEYWFSKTTSKIIKIICVITLVVVVWILISI